MRVLNPRLQLDVFFSRLRRAPERVLLVGYDGTLTPRAARVLNEISARPNSRVIRVSHPRFAVQQALAQAAAGAVCVYLGDDRTDEDTFDAMRRRGLAVLVRPELRRTGADLWLEPPRDLVMFLERWRTCAGML